MVRSSRLRLIRPGWSLHKISVRNHLSFRIAVREWTSHACSWTRQTGIEGRGRDTSTRSRTTRFLALIAALLLTVMGTPPAAAQTMEEARAAYARRDHAAAFQGFRVHAERGDAEARFNLGLMYGIGSGVSQDYAEAARWFRRAAVQGHTLAQFNLGLMYDNGEGVPQDYAETVRWYRRAAEQGNALAQLNLGLMYGIGIGVSQNYAEAARWFRRAAVQGDADAQFNLGLMYEYGVAGQGHATPIRKRRSGRCPAPQLLCRILRRSPQTTPSCRPRTGRRPPRRTGAAGRNAHRSRSPGGW